MKRELAPLYALIRGEKLIFGCRRSKNISVDEQNEIIADMVHHFMVPEVQKVLIRNRIRKQQKENLKAVHEAVYAKFADLPKIGAIRYKKNSLTFLISLIFFPVYPKVSAPTSPGVSTTTSTSKSKIEETEEVIVIETDYQDPYDMYLSRLVEQQTEGDDDEGNYQGLNVRPMDELALRLDDLETITEVDTESTSVKSPANTESSSEESINF